MITLVIALALTMAVGYMICRMKGNIITEDMLFDGFGPGTFTVPENQKSPLFYITFAQILAVLWIYANIPDIKYKFVATFYLFIIFFVVDSLKLEYLFPRRTEYISFVGVGDVDDTEGIGRQIIAGLAIAAATIVLFSELTALQVVVYGEVIASVLVTTISVPFIEEMFFGNYIPSMLLEKRGLVPAMLVSGSLFAIFHFLAYNADIATMFVVFVFRVLATLALYKFESFLPGLMAHSLMNFISLIEGGVG